MDIYNINLLRMDSIDIPHISDRFYTIAQT